MGVIGLVLIFAVTDSNRWGYCSDTGSGQGWRPGQEKSAGCLDPEIWQRHEYRTPAPRCSGIWCEHARQPSRINCVRSIG